MIAIIDVDGTLVDSNYQHTVTWQQALCEHDADVPAWRIHRHIGLGGDKLVAAVAGQEVEDRDGDAIREREGELYADLIDGVKPFEGAHELLDRLRDHDNKVVLASSAKPEEVAHYLDLLDARGLVNGWTSAGDVEQTKPSPDLVLVALDMVDADASDAWMIGDSVWDAEAASRSGVPTLGVLTGGYSEDELMKAGCAGVYVSVLELANGIAATALG